tara:strand:- start:237 stop:485 length:249 start_codon:yes stop_codon:yes gene_type:complete
MAIVEKKYCVIYNDDKSIKEFFFGINQSINTPHNSFGTDNYQDLVDYIYNNNLYENDESYIDYSKLKNIEQSVEQTIFNYDD